MEQTAQPQSTHVQATNVASGPNTQTHEARRQRAIGVLQSGAFTAPVATPAPEAPKSEEPPAVAEPETSKVEEPLAPRVKELVARETALAAREAEIEKKLAEATAKEQSLADFKDQPLKVLEYLGVTFQQLADAVLEDSKTPDPMKIALREMNKEITGLKKTLSDKEKAEKEAQERAEMIATEQKINSYKGRLNEFLDANKDKYEIIHLAEAKDMVFEVIEEYFAQHGKLLTPDEAAQKTEEYLERRVSNAMKAKKFTPKEPAPAAKPPQTLSEGLTNGTAPRVNTGGSTEKDRLARAVSLIRFD